MKPKDTYLDLNDKERGFIQNMVYAEYLEAMHIILHEQPESTMTVSYMIQSDLEEAEEIEDYERCQLYRDVLQKMYDEIDDIE